MDWSNYFLAIADTVRTKSKDPHAKIGAVIVGPERQIVSTGFNGFPRKIGDDAPERWEQPLKTHYVEHAERNAIYNAARHGIALRGCIMYLSGFGPPTIPCTECARAIIQSGIVEVVGRPTQPPPARWTESIEEARRMLTEAGVILWEVEA